MKTDSTPSPSQSLGCGFSILTLSAVIGGILWGLFDYTPKEAVGTALASGVGLVCGVPLLCAVVLALLLIGLVVFVLIFE